MRYYDIMHARSRLDLHNVCFQASPKLKETVNLKIQPSVTNNSFLISLVPIIFLFYYIFAAFTWIENINKVIKYLQYIYIQDF